MPHLPSPVFMANAPLTDSNSFLQLTTRTIAALLAVDLVLSVGLANGLVMGLALKYEVGYAVGWVEMLLIDGVDMFLFDEGL